MRRILATRRYSVIFSKALGEQFLWWINLLKNRSSFEGHKLCLSCCLPKKCWITKFFRVLFDAELLMPTTWISSCQISRDMSQNSLIPSSKHFQMLQTDIKKRTFGSKPHLSTFMNEMNQSIFQHLQLSKNKST